MKKGETLSSMLDKALQDRYGENAPEEIRTRVSEEMEQINANDWESDFLRAYQITRRLSQAGVPWLLCGADGGNSFVAYLLGITQVNPLPPHYYCPQCKRIEFVSRVKDGFDLPEKVCGVCGATMQGDGHGLDFSQFPQAHSLFGEYRLPACGVPLVHEVLSPCPEVTPFSRKWLGSEDYKLDGWLLVSPEQFENAVWVDGYIPPERKEKVKAVLRDENDKWNQLPKVELTTGGYVERLYWLCEKAGIKENSISPHDPVALESLFAALGNDCLTNENLAVTTGLCNLNSPFGKRREEPAERELRLKMAKETPCFSTLVQYRGLSGRMVDEIEKIPYNGYDVLCDRDSLLEYLKQQGATREAADILAQRIARIYNKRNLTEIKAQLETLSIDSQIKTAIEHTSYLQPRAHSVSFAAIYVRLAWFSLHYPDEYREALALF